MKTLQTTPEAIEPVQAIQATPLPKVLLKTTYTIERKPQYFYMKIIELYTDGTWKHIGNTHDEPLPHLFNRLEALLMKGIKL